ncbi:hypothetical protein KKD40_07455 [Candidatus Micrarchaeota archaeon]|nr:hypothetical protein [Candidatus Micrarchaeota archaeon]
MHSNGMCKRSLGYPTQLACEMKFSFDTTSSRHNGVVGFGVVHSIGDMPLSAWHLYDFGRAYSRRTFAIPLLDNVSIPADDIPEKFRSSRFNAMVDIPITHTNGLPSPIFISVAVPATPAMQLLYEVLKQNGKDARIHTNGVGHIVDVGLVHPDLNQMPMLVDRPKSTTVLMFELSEWFVLQAIENAACIAVAFGLLAKKLDGTRRLRDAIKELSPNSGNGRSRSRVNIVLRQITNAIEPVYDLIADK